MSDSETSDEDFRPEDNEESEKDSDYNEEDEKDIDIEKSGTKQRQLTIRTDKGEDVDFKKDELEFEEDKSRTDALWKDFLSDVKPETSFKNAADENNYKNIFDKNLKSIDDQNDSTSQKISKDSTTTVNAPELNEENQSIKRESLTNLQKPAPSMLKRTKTETLTNIQNPAASMLKRTFSSGGLNAVLSITHKKQKKSILDSSLQDWKNFKKDEGLHEELKEYNKGKDGYLERQDFLKRTDYRQFEIEKNLRRTRHK